MPEATSTTTPKAGGKGDENKGGKGGKENQFIFLAG